MWFPIMMFAISGFEHAIANMAFVPLGLMLGADADWRGWLYQNLIIVILGNIVGGGLVVGGAHYFLFDWTRLVKKSEAKQTDLLRKSNADMRDLAYQGDESPQRAPRCSAAGLTPSPSEPTLLPRDRVLRRLDLGQAGAVFRAFDADRDGALDERQALCALSLLGFCHPIELLRPMMQVAGGGGGGGGDGWAGLIGLGEFELLARRLHELECLGLSACGGSGERELCGVA
jgi:hypothetical protein